MKDGDESLVCLHDGPAAHHALAIGLGLHGDTLLRESSSIAPAMQVRRSGSAVELTREGVATAYDQVSPDLVVFLGPLRDRGGLATGAHQATLVCRAAAGRSRAHPGHGALQHRPADLGQRPGSEQPAHRTRRCVAMRRSNGSSSSATPWAGWSSTAPSPASPTRPGSRWSPRRSRSAVHTMAPRSRVACLRRWNGLGDGSALGSPPNSYGCAAWESATSPTAISLPPTGNPTTTTTPPTGERIPDHGPTSATTPSSASPGPRGGPGLRTARGSARPGRLCGPRRARVGPAPVHPRRDRRRARGHPPRVAQ